MENDNKYDPQKPTSGDVAHAVARVAGGTVPIAGAGATELLNAIITPPLEKRRNEWMRKIGEGLRELEKRMALWRSSPAAVSYLPTSPSTTFQAVFSKQL